MLQLKEIKKNYYVGDQVISALKGVSLDFRKCEYVSILGPSGCGKTTLMNVVGGLDKFDSGDILVNGKSTKDFADSDWDNYRNKKIGFVFQSYNLISHQTVAFNVELALTLSGISPEERRRRTVEALEKVGLKDQINKKPNQLSGGQMQRVAIARALVNNPEIILADEPTGALDSKTSTQILDILKEIAKERLVIMVTHNGELAQKYSTRIIRMLDGVITEDSDPYDSEKDVKYKNEVEQIRAAEQVQKGSKKGRAEAKKAGKKTSMSFTTALMLSFKNLLTKKTRTILTAVAGSIGIIGIALIMAVSNGMNIYIAKMQEDALASNPISISENSVDIAQVMDVLQSQRGDTSVKFPDIEKVLTSSKLQLSDIYRRNKIDGAYIEWLKENISEDWYNDMIFSTGVAPNIYGQKKWAGAFEALSSSNWQMLIGKDSAEPYSFINSQYDILADGRLPENINEVVLIVDQYNKISHNIAESLGFKTSTESEKTEIPFEKVLGTEFLILKNDQKYLPKTNFTSADLSDPNFDFEKNYFEEVKKVNESDKDNDKYLKVKIVGILRINDKTDMGVLSNGIGYTKALYDQLNEWSADSSLIADWMKANFEKVFEENKVYITASAQTVLSSFTDADPETIFQAVKAVAEEIVGSGITVNGVKVTNGLFDPRTEGKLFRSDSKVTGQDRYSSFSSLLRGLGGYIDKDYTVSLTGAGTVAVFPAGYAVNEIKIYPIGFDSKTAITGALDAYNEAHDQSDMITYLDPVEIFFGMLKSLVDIISYVLIAFTSISLVVSSIMIGIITYVSVLERTKEIGILRAIGARKKDIAGVFNAETAIVGFTAGLIGVLIALLLSIPINLIIKALAGVAGIASLAPLSALFLIALSVGLTMLSGLIPSRIAAKKDPVVALRTE